MGDSHPDSTTIPSADSAPVAPAGSKAGAPRPPPRPPLLQKLRYLLAQRLRNAAQSTDRNLLRLSALLSTPSGIDVVLCTTGYTLTLVYALGQRVLEKQLASVATELADKAADVMLPGETLIAELPAPAGTKLLAQTVGSSKAIAGVIADYRIFVRMWGMLGLYTWARDTYLSPLPREATQKEKLLRGTTWAAIASCVLFQVLENGAYAASKGMLTSEAWTGEAGKKRETWWWVWSSRFWAAYVGCEIVRLLIERAYKEPSVEVAGEGEKEDKLRLEQERKESYNKTFTWWKDLVSNIAYAPMTLHWSVEEGLMSDVQVGICGMIAGGAMLADAWRKTA
ncbi:peroxin 11C [Stagonosporopsis vannaccii]|nr:peroxin 11C [Stagonosporopsis vannaccii]